MRKLNKAKRTGGEILSVRRILEKHPMCVKNFAIWLRYDSRTGTHNMYKEFRDMTKVGAVSQMYSEMAGRHRAQASNIQIIKAIRLPQKKCKRVHITQLHGAKLKFPAIRRLPLVPKSMRSLYVAKRPVLFKK
eukprot:GHVU01174743.1.p1 GENE.GHVU01174743.1~~GHVU01174743.1.p1  ORF type:complete len:133 (+),score=11.40 GHVU01174743.1:3-401(+)